MRHILHDWFGWPDGSVLTNLVASGLVGLAVLRKLFRMHKHQRRHQEHVERELAALKTHTIGGQNDGDSADQGRPAD